MALHAAVGASISGLTGGSVAGGALSAGASEAASSLTTGQTKLVQELASTVIGAAGAAIGGGSATAGGATALAGQLYNRELHPDELAALKAYQEGKTPEEREAAAMVACKLLNCFVTGTADGSEAKPDTYNADLKIAVDQWVAANPEAYAKIAADLGKTGLFTSTAAETKADAAVINWAETKGGGWKALQADQLANAQASGRLTPDVQTQIVTTAQGGVQVVGESATGAGGAWLSILGGDPAQYYGEAFNMPVAFQSGQGVGSVADLRLQQSYVYGVGSNTMARDPLANTLVLGAVGVPALAAGGYIGVQGGLWAYGNLFQASDLIIAGAELSAGDALGGASLVGGGYHVASQAAEAIDDIAKTTRPDKITSILDRFGLHETPPGAAPDLEATGKEYVDILSPETKQHILYGDGPQSGGHLWPGQTGKTPFPEGWSGDKIVHEVGDIATSPNTKWYAQTGNGGIYLNNGAPARWVAYEVRDGVRMRVVYQPATNEVITAFPDQAPIPNYKPIK